MRYNQRILEVFGKNTSGMNAYYQLIEVWPQINHTTKVVFVDEDPKSEEFEWYDRYDDQKKRIRCRYQPKNDTFFILREKK